MKEVKKINGLSYLEIYKKATDCLIAQSLYCLKYKRRKNMNTITVEDLKFLNEDYRIVSADEDPYDEGCSIQFHVKECPGWAFGIWWSSPTQSKTGRTTVRGCFFTQYEETIEKFKPSYSQYSVDIEVDPEEKIGDNMFLWPEIPGIILYIHEHPELAFCRDYCGWNYNTEYHSEEEAKETFNHYCFLKHEKYE